MEGRKERLDGRSFVCHHPPPLNIISISGSDELSRLSYSYPELSRVILWPFLRLLLGIRWTRPHGGWISLWARTGNARQCKNDCRAINSINQWTSMRPGKSREESQANEHTEEEIRMSRTVFNRSSLFLLVLTRVWTQWRPCGQRRDLNKWSSVASGCTRGR